MQACVFPARRLPPPMRRPTELHPRLPRGMQALDRFVSGRDGAGQGASDRAGGGLIPVREERPPESFQFGY